MKLSEVYHEKGVSVDTHLGGLNPQTVLWQTGQHVTDVGGNPIYKYNIAEQNTFLFTLQKHDTLLTIQDVDKQRVESHLFSLLVLVKINNPFGVFFMTKRAWTVPVHRRKGAMLNLVDSLYRKLNYKLMSDNVTTDIGIDLWKGISAKLPVHVLDTDTGDRTPRTQVPDNVIYSDPHPSKNQLKYLLVLEYDSHSVPTLEYLGISNGRIEPNNAKQLLAEGKPLPYSYELLIEYFTFRQPNVNDIDWWKY